MRLIIANVGSRFINFRTIPKPDFFGILVCVKTLPVRFLGEYFAHARAYFAHDNQPKPAASQAVVEA